MTELKTSDVSVASRPTGEDLLERFSEDNAESIKKSGLHFMVRNVDQLPSRLTKSDGNTAVVLGLARSGTTMTAGAMMLLGVRFSDRVNRRMGDRDIGNCFDAVRASLLRWRVIFLRSRFKRIVKERDRVWREWAFKSPGFVEYTWLLAGTLRNPVYIVPIRNPFSTSFGFAEHTKGSWRKSFFSIPYLQLLLLSFCLRTRRPVLMFSYEQAAKNPELLVDLITQFLNLEVSAEDKHKALAYIDPSQGYQTLQPLEGFVDALEATRIAGWVTEIDRPDHPVSLEIIVDGKVVAAAQADVMRPDVREHGRHPTGVCGFDIPLDPGLTDREMGEVVVYAPELKREFWRPSQA